MISLTRESLTTPSNLGLAGGRLTVAALYVMPRGPYAGLDDVEPWDEARDARAYAGPHPVVAHPPCARWCRLAGLVEARWGHRRGDDDGCFASALAAVRTWGGVLEHPAWSDAWSTFGLPRPRSSGGWMRGACGGYSCHVEQGRYGHRAKKATWLYAFGVDDLPDLKWGRVPDQETHARVSWCGNATRGQVRPRLTKSEAKATPPEFRDLLLSIARSANVRDAAPRVATLRSPRNGRGPLGRRVLARGGCDLMPSLFAESAGTVEPVQLGLGEP